MTDPDRDIEQALVTLKKGTQLIKYCRKGRPKFRPFRLSPDETTLIWYSHGQERTLQLSLVSKIFPGQRTPVFKRYCRPEKEYLSFSLIYKNGERPLDLIRKDNAEVEIWLAGLRHLISQAQNRTKHTNSDLSDFQDGSSDTSQNSHPFDVTTSGRASMQGRPSCADGRISVSNTPSCTTHTSGPDDIESLGDVYLWGKVCYDATFNEGSAKNVPLKTDVLTPKLLESNIVIDVHQIASIHRI